MIIAEIGQNHNGDMSKAHELIIAAKESGADLAKFQLYDSKKLYYEVGHNELIYDQAEELFNFGKQEGIEVFFSVFDVERVKWCKKIGVKRYKVAYSQRDNTFLRISLAGGNIIVSTDDIWLEAKNLYCIPEYPAQLKNFSLVDFTEYDGFSDHTIGLDAAKIAIARGAKIIEKHFAFSHDLKDGVDAPWSMTPEECRELRRWYDVVQECLK